jgi:predicted phosphodiesterase
MKRVAWMTDIHLEFINRPALDAFLESVRESRPAAMLLTGDICPAAGLRGTLLHMAEQLAIPIYFVLGNHDFYGSDILLVREDMARLTQEDRGVIWMPVAGVVELAPGIGLVGHDGWSDGRYGHFMLSPIILNDYLFIASLKIANKEDLLKRLNALGDEAAAYLRAALADAVQRFDRIYVLIHPPPFMEACWHENKLPYEDDVYLPHFACKAIGDLLLECTSQHPQTEFTVLCGHTHGGGAAQIRDNLLVLTGQAEYGEPAVQRIFEFRT